MTLTSRIAATAATAVLTATALTGCSSTSVDDASSDYCESLSTLESEIESLRSLVASDATVDEVTEQRDTVVDAYQATVDAGEDLDSAVSDAASGAYSSFEDSVGDISGDASVSEAAGDYTSASEAYLTELDSIATEAGCSS